jgi:penicillin-binding protein 2
MRLTELKNQEHELQRFRLRLSISAGFVLTLFAVLLVRFVWLQIVQHDYYLTKAEDNRISIVPIVPNRGVITDVHGEVLARSYSAYTLEITPGKVADLEQTINGLAEVIDIQAKDRKRFYKTLDESKGVESLAIRNRLTDEEVARFAANRYRFPGVDIHARLFRQYPLGTSSSHVLGYIGRINDNDQDAIDTAGLSANYRGTDHIGKSGLEQSYERELHGTTGSEQVEVDAGGHAVRVLARMPPVSGNNLKLTLDVKLQAVVEKLFGDRRGALVAIDPKTGGILALVSMPGFDPNLFIDGIDPQNWDLLNNSIDRPMINRALNGTYPPGSTFKPYLALAALELGKRTPQQTIFDPGYFNFGDHRFRDDKPGGHGTVDMYKSIVASCDTYYYMLANDLGIDNISSFVRQFGFGSLTGIDIQGESKGVLPSQEWKRQRFKKPEQQKWYAGETISIGIGQGYNSYTPLQLAQAVATLANNGVMYRPHLVNYIEDAKTGAHTPVEPTPVRTLDIKPENLEIIKHAMRGVILEGTGARAFAGAPYEAAGKTGTAQVVGLKDNEKYVESKVKERNRDHALFIAFAPVENPTIALAVLVENSGFGNKAAAPIARAVLDYYLLGKLPPGPVPDSEDTEEVD